MAKKKINENSLKNLEKRVKFTKDNQPSEESKSNGQINLSKEKNILYSLRTGSQDRNLIKLYLDCIENQLQNGDTREASKLFGIIKENEVQEIKNTGSIEVQKVFITKEEERQVNKHIDDIIDM